VEKNQLAREATVLLRCSQLNTSMRNVKVLEHNGFYTAYRETVKRRDDGSLYESVSPIRIPIPPPERINWPHWAALMTDDELEVALQIYFDKWNFGRGSKPSEKELFGVLSHEQDNRRDLETSNDILSGMTFNGSVTITPPPKNGVKVDVGWDPETNTITVNYPNDEPDDAE
jgi:hypothetical protein